MEPPIELNLHFNGLYYKKEKPLEKLTDEETDKIRNILGKRKNDNPIE